MCLIVWYSGTSNGAEENLISEVEMHASVVLWVGKGVLFRKILIEGFLCVQGGVGRAG